MARKNNQSSHGEKRTADTRSPLDRGAVVAHLVVLLGDDQSTPDDIYHHLKGALRWSKAAAQTVIDDALNKAWVMIVSSGSGALQQGEAFQCEAYPKERVVAERAAERHFRIPNLDRKQDRRDAIFNTLRGKACKSTTDIWRTLEPVFGYRRKLERELIDLEKAGQIARENGGWVDCRESVAIADSVTATALRLLQDVVGDLVPHELQSALKQQFLIAKKKLEKASPDSSDVRWVNALRVIPPRHRLDDPLIIGAVRDVVEDAILRGVKVRLRWLDMRPSAEPDEHEGIYSISHFLVEIPANPAIDVWSGGRGRRIALRDILEAEALDDEPADRAPIDYEPDPFPQEVLMSFGDAKSHDGLTKITLRVNSAALSRMRRQRIGNLLTVISPIENDWLSVEFRHRVDVPLIRYLKDLDGVVVLGPRLLRAFVHSSLEVKRRAFDQSVEMANALFRENESHEWISGPD